MNDSAKWDGILEDGEKILWQGRPDNSLNLFGSIGQGTFIGLGFVGIVGFITYEQLPGINVKAWMISAFPILLIGIGTIFFDIFGPSLRRGKTWYTLTNRRALIATIHPVFRRRKLEHFWLNPSQEARWKDTSPPSIIFETRSRRRGQYRRVFYDVGFERIDEADKVLTLIDRAKARWND